MRVLTWNGMIGVTRLALSSSLRLSALADEKAMPYFSLTFLGTITLPCFSETMILILPKLARRLPSLSATSLTK